jgi:ethanolamine utilization protein EutN
MMIGKVVSKVVSTRKYDSLQGFKLLVIQPCYGDKGACFVAADELGAGEGELVLVSTGDTARYALNKDTPIDSIVVGIIDVEPTIDGASDAGDNQ